MGIKGTVRRSTDGHIIHANIDTDVIIAEEPPYGQLVNHQHYCIYLSGTVRPNYGISYICITSLKDEMAATAL